MPYYGVPGQQAALTTTYKSLATLWASGATKRIKLYEFIPGAVQVPNATDCQIQVDISRIGTTTGLAGTAYTPNLYDPADGSAVTLAANIITTEPVVLAAGSGLNLVNFGINQRATARWVASQESQYLVVPATAQAGLTIRALSSNYGTSFQGMASFME
jgi:hypothetical protein